MRCVNWLLAASQHNTCSVNVQFMTYLSVYVVLYVCMYYVRMCECVHSPIRGYIRLHTLRTMRSEKRSFLLRKAEIGRVNA